MVKTLIKIGHILHTIMCYLIYLDSKYQIFLIKKLTQKGVIKKEEKIKL